MYATRPIACIPAAYSYCCAQREPAVRRDAVDDRRRDPPAVADFVARCIPTVVHMEALLLLRSRPNQPMQLDAIASALYLDAAAARHVLDDLCKHGLVHTQSAASLRYSPYSAELKALVDDLAETHATKLIPLSRLIHERASALNLDEFAKAFRLRKD